MGYFRVWSEQCEEARQSWRGREKFVYNIVANEIERRKELKFLKYLMLFVVYAVWVGGWLVGCICMSPGQCGQERRMVK